MTKYHHTINIVILLLDDLENLFLALSQHVFVSTNRCYAIGGSGRIRRMALSAPLEELIERSRRLGADRTTTNFGGGNTSAKGVATDPVTGEEVEVLWVKGSGGDLRTLTESGVWAAALPGWTRSAGTTARHRTRGLPCIMVRRRLGPPKPRGSS